MRACEFIVESVDFEQMQPQNIVAVAQQAFAQLYPGVKLYGKSVVEGVGLTTAKGQAGAASAFAGSDTVRGAFYLTLNAYAEEDSMIVVIEDATAGNYKGAATAVIKSLFEAGERLYRTQQRELVINDNANVEAWSVIADRVGAEMMESTELIKEYKINNQSGIGSVPKNQEIDYFGLRVAMRPSTFLKLALPMPNTAQDQEAVEYVKQQKDTLGIGAPFLEIDIPEGWESGDLSKPARIVGHDGRHRMAAIMQSEGDDPIEVHLFPLGLRRRHFDANPDWAKELNRVIVGQRGNTVLGPVFHK
jgi:hypothetical protein